MSSFIAILISLASLGIVLYKQFIQGAELHSSVDSVTIMRITQASRNALYPEIMIDDLTDTNPSPEALDFIKHFPTVKPFVQNKDRNSLWAAILQATQGNIRYDPPADKVQKYISDERFGSSFFVPLVIYNSGARYANVSSLIMVVTDASVPSKKWAYVCFTELEPEKLLDRSVPQTDLQRISKLFAGFSVAPGGSTRVNPWFTPLKAANKKIISIGNVSPGLYRTSIFGFDSEGHCLFQTAEVTETFTNEQMVNAFNGNESMDYLRYDNHVEQAVFGASPHENGAPWYFRWSWVIGATGAALTLTWVALQLLKGFPGDR